MRALMVLLTALLAVAGCASGSKNTETKPPEPAAVISETDAIKIARDAVAAKEQWGDRTFCDAKRTETGWTVIVWRIEAYDDDNKPLVVPGGHRIILLDMTGKVTDYFHGE